jgi:hypothetical protein
MFQDLGGRITGSLALSFIPTEYQGASLSDEDRAKGVLNACAVLHTGAGDICAPYGIAEEFISLRILPHPPPPPPATPTVIPAADDGAAAQQVGSAGKS